MVVLPSPGGVQETLCLKIEAERKGSGLHETIALFEARRCLSCGNCCSSCPEDAH